MKIMKRGSYAHPEVLAPLFAHFGANSVPVTDQETRTWVAVSDDGTCAGTAIVRLGKGSSWHLWYLGVLPQYQRLGVGEKLFTSIENEARESGISAIRTRTYARWAGMRHLLVKRGWAFANAHMGEHHDGIEEEWLLPLRREPLRVVLVGANPCGRGAELAAAMKEQSTLVRIVGVCDNDSEVLRSWNEVPTSTDVGTLLDSVDADAAVLALPHVAYQELRPEFLKRGIGLLHEKPLACSLSELLKLQDMLTKRPVPLVVGVQRRSHPSYVFLKHALQSKLPDSLEVRMSLGRPTEEVSPDSDKNNCWRMDSHLAGGGALIDIGYHAIDLVHFLLEAPLETISCNLWVGDRPANAGELETNATLIGRAGTTWVKIIVDRAGVKSESVVATGEIRWHADRTGVRKNGIQHFSCPGSWDLAVRGQIATFVDAYSSPIKTVSLWDHLAELRVIEQSRTIASIQGIGASEITT